ncbi:hypothetical protein D1007_52028 [Hordeum vulgare]|nr:hypothetical protein D1007_52028 [Hordeum vulgare]
MDIPLPDKDNDSEDNSDEEHIWLNPYRVFDRSNQVPIGDHETGPALLHLVRYVRAQEALYDQVTLDLIAARADVARLRRREAEPEDSNPVVLFGRPIEL